MWEFNLIDKNRFNFEHLTLYAFLFNVVEILK